MKRILDIKTSTFYDEGNEKKNIQFQYGVMKINITLNDRETNQLLRAIILDKSDYPVEVRSFDVPPIPIGKMKRYFEFNEDTFKPRTVDFET